MKNKKPSTTANSFLLKIYDILNNESNHDKIRWTSQGKAFEIVNLSVFVNEILPVYFKHKNFSSFIRQLNMYDFHKVPGESYIFSHPLFTNGNYENLQKIKRKNSSANFEKNAGSGLLKKIRKLQENNEKIGEEIERIIKMQLEANAINQVLVGNLMMCQEKERNLEEILRISMNCLKGEQDPKTLMFRTN